MDKKIYKLYSFDVFDTLITRTTATPLGIFALIEDKLKKSTFDMPSNIKNNFYYLRIECERNIRKYFLKDGKEDFSIYDIYNYLSLNNFLSDKQKQFLINLEIETEIENSIPIEANIKILKSLVNENYKVVLISDMYLTSDIIRKILTKHDNIFKNINIYSSSDYSKTKHSGNLYKIVKDIENIDYKEWKHMGDNEYSDIFKAKKLSIDTELFCYEQLLDFEKRIIHSNMDDSSIQLLVGLSRNIRLDNQKMSYPKKLGISLGGQIFIGYIEWILDCSLKYNIKNIYFIARDGFGLKTMADIIIKNKNLNIKTYYIYGSREAWQLPSICCGLDIPSSFLWKSNTIEELMYFFNLDKSEFFKFLPKKYRKLNKILCDKDRKNLKNILYENYDFKDYVISKNKNKYYILRDYLKQEINFDEKFAFVDLRGSGETQERLSAIINSFCKIQIFTFYFYYQNNKIDTLNNKNFSFFPNGNYMHNSIELLSRAQHGQTIGYEYIDKKIQPILENIENNKMKDILYYDYIDGIKYFAEYYTCFNKNIKYNIKLFIEYQKYLTSIIDKNIADFFGSIPFKMHGKVINVIEYAPKISLLDSIRYIFINDIPYYNNINMSLSRSSKFVRSIYKFKIKYKTIFRFILDLRFNSKDKYSYIVIFGIKISFKNY